MRRFVMQAVFVLCAAFGTASSLAAQEAASIVGVVRDTSGAVMPGVTIEASSPALIEKVRNAVTDGSGRFAIIDLRPGSYVVAFTLPGFKSVRREGIILAGAFAATVNAELEVGALEETVTVSGASPIVDLQSTQNQFVANRDVLDVLPATRSMQGGASLVPGVNFYSQGFVSTMSVHGSASSDQRIYFDGSTDRPEPDGHRQPGERDRRERSGAGRTGLRRRLAVGGNLARRRAHGLDPQGRRQPVQRIGAILLFERFAAERQRARRSPAVHSRGRLPANQLESERDVRWTDRERPPVVLHGVPHLPVGQLRRQHVFSGRFTREPQRCRGAERTAAPDRPDQPEKQAPRRVLQLERQYPALRRGLHGDQRQSRVVRFSGSVVPVADSCPAGGGCQVDLDAHQPAAPRSRAIVRRGELSIQLPAGSGAVRCHES